MKPQWNEAFEFAGEHIAPGERRVVHLPIASLYDFTQMTIPVEIVNGVYAGPRLFISGCIHGDEIIGVEIIRQLLEKKSMTNIRGTLMAIPVVNVFGFNNRSRYLPDRRDLNRSFPGSIDGSLASRMAHIFMKEVVAKATHGIDIHTGAIHRSNLPQVRASLDHPASKDLALAFRAPIVLNARLRDGSLREAARKKRIPMLLFEAGEALRFDDFGIRAGLRGCLSVMESIGMLPVRKERPLKKEHPSLVAKDSFWLRAPNSGAFKAHKFLGELVKKNEVLGSIHDLFGRTKIEVIANEDGVIIGYTKLPLVNRGDAIFHIATFKQMGKISSLGHLFDREMAI